MITETTPQIKYAVFVAGQQIGIPHQSVQLAELAISQLPKDQMHLVEIKPVTSNGQTLLLG